MSIKEQLLWLWAVMVFGAGNKRIWELSANYEDITEFASDLARGRVSGMSDTEKKRVREVKPDDVKKVYTQVVESGTKIYCYGSEGYPQALTQIADPPAVLFCKGNLDFLNDRSVLAVVGTREPSEYSDMACRRFSRELSRRDVVIASGLAKGIDTAAVTAAFENGKPVVGVYAKAFEECSDETEKELINAVSQNGAVITEYYPGAQRNLYAFKNRNRIMIGISSGVLFVECSSSSRGLDNYIKALSQGKQIYVMSPHDVFDNRYSGQAHMIRNGCKAVFAPWDILSSLGIPYSEYLDSDDIYLRPSDDFIEKKPRGKKSSSKKAKPNDEKPRETAASELDKLEPQSAKLCELMMCGPMLADELAVKSGLDITEVFGLLTELELEGYVKSYAGKMYGLV